MATEWISPTWRMPEVSNQSKFENYSLDFNGGTEAIDIGVSSLVQNDPYSLSFWMKRNGSSVFGGTMLTLGNGTMVNNIVLWWKNSTTLTISNGQGTNYYRDLPSTTYNIGQWYHISIVGTIGTYSPVDLEVYLDGVPLVHTSTSSAISANQSTSAIGKLPNNAGFNWTGVMSNLSIFDYKLSTDQINYLYNSGTPQNPMAISGQPPIAYYPLGGGSTGDAGTSPNTLTVPNESVPSATVFDVSGTDYIKVNNSPSIEPAKNLTVSVWVNWKTGSNTYSYAINKYYNGSNGSYGITRVNQPRFFIFTSTGVVVSPIASSVNLTDTGWHHLVGTYDGSYVRFYVNGAEIGSGTAETGDMIYNTGDLFIGAYQSSGILSPNGEQSNVQIWDTSLSATEITTLYNNGVPYTGTQPQAANLKGWWKMNVDTSTWNGTDWIIGDARTSYNKCLNFPDANDYIRYNSFTMNGKSEISFSFWYNHNITLNFNDKILGTWDTTYWAFAANQGRSGVGVNGDVFLQIKTGDNVSSSTASVSIPNIADADSGWNLLTATYDGSNFRGYLNGEQVGSDQPITGNLMSSTGAGSRNLNVTIRDGAGAGMAGMKISNFVIWDKGLTSPEVATLLNGGTPFSQKSYFPQQANMLLWNTLTDINTSPGGGVFDNSGNGIVIESPVNPPVSFDLLVSTLNGTSDGMTTANLVNSDLMRSIPYSSYSMEFDAAGTDRINFGNPSNLQITSSFSVSVWIKQTTQQDAVVISKDAFSTNRCWGLWSNAYSSNNFVQFLVWDASNAIFYVDSNIRVDDGNWHHLTAVYDASNSLKIYIDGVLNNTNSTGIPSSIADKTVDIILGESNTSGAYEFPGNISNAAIFNSAITEDQVLSIYNGGVPNDISSLSPVSWWSLAGDSYYNGINWICPDLGSGGNNGTSANLAATALVSDGPGSTANGIATSMNIPGDLKGNAPNSSTNAFSVNMGETDRVEDVAPTP